MNDFLTLNHGKIQVHAQNGWLWELREKSADFGFLITAKNRLAYKKIQYFTCVFASKLTRNVIFSFVNDFLKLIKRLVFVSKNSFMFHSFLVTHISLLLFATFVSVNKFTQPSYKNVILCRVILFVLQMRVRLTALLTTYNILDRL